MVTLPGRGPGSTCEVSGWQGGCWPGAVRGPLRSAPRRTQLLRRRSPAPTTTGASGPGAGGGARGARAGGSGAGGWGSPWPGPDNAPVGYRRVGALRHTVVADLRTDVDGNGLEDKQRWLFALHAGHRLIPDIVSAALAGRRSPMSARDRLLPGRHRDPQPATALSPKTDGLPCRRRLSARRVPRRRDGTTRPLHRCRRSARHRRPLPASRSPARLPGGRRLPPSRGPAHRRLHPPERSVAICGRPWRSSPSSPSWLGEQPWRSSPGAPTQAAAVGAPNQ
jgi:hypothetical protein